ncbi:hypothetical protein M9H77_26894 [Catharanthus roseus]|uniref:Uncharacterized protein n=1 Tax=Catharanthus roseus TaxID=4058 RepID=A0ACC0ABY6_CATRO|nr:hypothetical protein M9H77_26894 [Catharanthus roseus]
MALVMRKFKRFYKKSFNNRGKKPPFKKRGQSSSLFKARAPDRFISVKEAANFEEWTRNRRKIAPGHRVDLSDMQGMEAIPTLFDMIGWVPLLTINELYYPKMIYEFYANLHKGIIERVENIPHQWVLSRIGGRDIAFDDRRMNYGFIAIEHMLATQSSSTKCLPYVYIHEKGFEKNNEGQLVRGGQDDNDKEDDDDEEQEEMNMDEEESDSEPEEETHKREIRRKKRQERTEEGSSLGSVTQPMEMIASLQASMNSQFDDLDGKISDIQERVMRLERGRRVKMIENFLSFPCFLLSYQT